MSALEKIASDLRKLAEELDRGETISAFDLSVLATRAEAQAEMHREGLDRD